MADRRFDAAAERAALAAFCAALPMLVERAARGFWQDTLEMHVAEVAGGGPAVRACRELGLHTGEEDPHRGGDEGLAGASAAWLPLPALVGDYRCPLARCDRRAGRDEQARPPRCAVSGEPMRYVRQDPA
jgi:hypothetical protein